MGMYAGLDAHEVKRLVGATMIDILEGRPLADPTPPRLPAIRRISGRLARVNGYIMMAFAAAMGSGPPPDFARSSQFVALARAVCRDPDPGVVAAALERIDALLAAAEQLLGAAPDRARAAVGLVMAAGVIAATEPLPAQG